MAPADDMLKKLRRLPENMVCANCGTDAQRGIGFGNVCVAFKTFVCDYCKTSHQAISHRVKSVSMSEWTVAEVKELMAAEGGGNNAARNIWLANAPEIGKRYQGGTRPKKGDRIEVFKQFVLDCYELSKFKGDAGGANSIGGSAAPFPKANAATAAASSNSGSNSAVGASGPWGPAAKSKPATLALAKPAVTVDLLGDMGSEGDGSGVSSSSGGAGFDFMADSGGCSSDPFADFGGSAAAAAAPSSSVPQAAFDPFGSSVADPFTTGPPTTATTHAGPMDMGGLSGLESVFSAPSSSAPNTGLNKPNPMGGVGSGMAAIGGMASPRTMNLQMQQQQQRMGGGNDPFAALGGGARGGGAMMMQQPPQQQQQQMGGMAMHNNMGNMGTGMGMVMGPQGTMRMNGPNSGMGGMSIGGMGGGTMSGSCSNVSTAMGGLNGLDASQWGAGALGQRPPASIPSKSTSSSTGGGSKARADAFSSLSFM